MAYDDQDAIPVSALQHWAYCPRQCGLIHLEQAFDQNVHTLRGNAVHAQVDQTGMELRNGLRIVRALPLWSERLGLVGKADVVEFEQDGTPYPVEYKHGSRHKAASIGHCDDIQLVAQAVCLEEMTGRPVPEGALYYATSHRRRPVVCGEELRSEVETIAESVRLMLAAGILPVPTADTTRCKSCSLKERCLPDALSRLGDPKPGVDLFRVDEEA